MNCENRRHSRLKCPRLHIKMNFRQLDLNLLRVLGAVYRSGSVTEAGHQLALSQPPSAMRWAAAPLLRGSAVRALTGRVAPDAAGAPHPPVRCRCCANSKPSCSAANHSTRHRSRALAALAIGPGRAVVPAPAGAPRAPRGTGLPPVQRVGAGRPAGHRAGSDGRRPAIGILNPQHRGVASGACSASTSWRSARRTGSPRGWRAGSMLSARQLAAAALVVADPRPPRTAA